jgi:hypothetical protein
MTCSRLLLSMMFTVSLFPAAACNDVRLPELAEWSLLAPVPEERTEVIAYVRNNAGSLLGERQVVPGVAGTDPLLLTALEQLREGVLADRF